MMQPGDSPLDEHERLDLPSAESEFGRLVADVCSGTATAADQARLDALLADPGQRRAYVALMRLHGELLWRWRQTRREGEAAILPRLSSPRSPRWWRPLVKPEAISFAVAAAVLFAGLVLANFAPMQAGGQGGFGGRFGRGPIVAEITGLDHVEWADPRQAPPLWLKAGAAIDVDRGFVELTHACGARTLVEGPAVVQVISSTSTRLVRGMMAVRYDRPNAAAPPFIVQTPSAAITDLGTEFAIGVEPAGATQVHVFDGLAEVEPAARDSDLGPTRLAAGDAASVGMGGDLSRDAVPLSRRITRRLPGREPTPEWIEGEAEAVMIDDFAAAGGTAWHADPKGWRLANGRFESTGSSVAVLPIAIEPGAVYRISVEVTLPAGDRGYAAVGFGDFKPERPFHTQTFALMGQRATMIPIWGGNFVYGGPGMTNRIGDVDSRFGTCTRMVQLDTRGQRWKAKFFCNGEPVAWYTFPAEPPLIQSIQLATNDAPTAAFDNLRVSVYRPRAQ